MAKHGPNAYGKPKNIGATLRRLLRYLGKSAPWLIVVSLCLAASTVCSLAGSYLLKPIINDYIIPGDFPGLARMLALMACVYILGAALSYLYSRIMVRIAQKTVAELRRELFDKMQTLPLRYFDAHPHGELMSLYTNDIETISELINSSLGSLVSSVLTFAGVLGMMFVLNWKLSLITIVFLALMFALVGGIGGRSRVAFARQQASLGALGGYIEEMIEGQKVIKVFNREAQAQAGFAERNEAFRIAATSAHAYASMMMPAMGNLSRINSAVTCCVGGLLAIGGYFDIGTMATYLNCVKQVSQPIGQVSQQVNVILAAVAGAERVFAVMDAASEEDAGKVTLVRVRRAEDGSLTACPERTGLWAWKRPDGSLIPLRGDVRFENVVFGYSAEKTVLRGVSLYAKPGQKIAFVGSTGAGKTTITNLINRFYEIGEGTITYDGIDVREIEKDSLRRSLGIVLQDTHLFTGTVMDNIRYGRLDATDEECIAAAKLANADTFIRHLPQGYDTLLTGNGGSLSQGERQLLAIARAAVSDPPVLILDEATSSIDTRTEKLIERGMDSLMEGRTVFVIAHRLSTVRNAQAILVLEGGEIIERGDHDDLMAQRGRYYRLCTGESELS